MKPLVIECPNLTCIINQSWPGCTHYDIPCSNSYARVIDAVLRMLHRIYSIHSLKKCNVFNRAKKNSPGSVDLYAKCIKEGPVEWTKPERALEAAKNVWTKSKLRLVSTSVRTVYLLLEQ